MLPRRYRQVLRPTTPGARAAPSRVNGLARKRPEHYRKRANRLRAGSPRLGAVAARGVSGADSRALASLPVFALLLFNARLAPSRLASSELLMERKAEKRRKNPAPSMRIPTGFRPGRAFGFDLFGFVRPFSFFKLVHCVRARQATGMPVGANSFALAAGTRSGR